MEKITEYLLNPFHADGGPKARFFFSFGFSDQAWEVIAAALCSHAQAYEVVSTRPTYKGMNYSVVGPIQSPDGRNPIVRTVWYIATGDITPRFVSAYPGEVRDDHDY